MQFWSTGLSISTRDVVNGDDMVDSKVEKLKKLRTLRETVCDETQNIPSLDFKLIVVKKCRYVRTGIAQNE
jgi:hypothetical protein